MTLKEFTLAVESYSDKMNQEIDIRKKLLAWTAANIINYNGFVKKPVTPKKLLGIEKDLKDTYKSKEEFKKALRGGGKC